MFNQNTIKSVILYLPISRYGFSFNAYEQYLGTQLQTEGNVNLIKSLLNVEFKSKSHKQLQQILRCFIAQVKGKFITANRRPKKDH